MRIIRYLFSNNYPFTLKFYETAGYEYEIQHE